MEQPYRISKSPLLAQAYKTKPARGSRRTILYNLDRDNRKTE